ncbi:unnamed protein product, partial [Didymodactylos carnosus]
SDMTCVKIGKKQVTNKKCLSFDCDNVQTLKTRRCHMSDLSVDPSTRKDSDNSHSNELNSLKTSAKTITTKSQNKLANTESIRQENNLEIMKRKEFKREKHSQTRSMAEHEKNREKRKLDKKRYLLLQCGIKDPEKQ